jgi:hypothetical protein
MENKQYTIEEILGQKVIWYEEDGIRYSFGTNPSNRDYQEYLKSLDETSTL